MGPIFRVSLRQLASRRRLLLIFILALLPIGLATLVSLTISGEETSNRSFINGLLDALLISGILPIVIMVLATATFGNELEDRTLSYLVLKPVARWRIVLPKLLAPITIGGPLLVASGIGATILGASSIGVSLLTLDNDVRAVVAVGVALLVGVITYAAIFTWTGLITTRALAFGLVYVFLWEGLLSSFLDGIRYLSVRGYMLAVMHGLDDSSFATLEGRVIEFPAAIGGTIAVTVVFFLLSVRRLRRMDVP